ncbi:MAG: AEC family transporter [Anaerolineales bacterium]|nr:AEC family transporter [Anaerolineales bacterium]
MSELASIFLNNILPIFLAAAGGFALGKAFNLDPRPVSQVAFNIFSPCLIFYLLTSLEVSGEAVATMALFATINILLMGGMAWVAGRLLKLERGVLAAAILTVMIGNNGNYGLAVNKFAFGEAALAYASVYFVTGAIIFYTIGVIIASMGKVSLKQAALELVKVPAVYAVIFALLFNAVGWHLPLPIDRTVELLSEAAIPVLLVLLGLQLQRSTQGNNLRALGMSVFLKLAITPLVALGLARLMGLSGPAWQAGITEAAMPTAIMSTIVASEYDVEPSLVTAIVLVSTLLSPLTLTPLLAYLGA